MRYCPRPDCPERLRSGRAPRFDDTMESCSACGAPLEEEPEGDASAGPDGTAGTDGHPVTVATFFNPHSAHLARTLLETVHLRPSVVGSHFPVASLAGWVRLQVAGPLAPLATHVLSEAQCRDVESGPEEDSWRRRRKIRWARGVLLFTAGSLLLAGIFWVAVSLTVQSSVAERLRYVSDDEVIGYGPTGRPVTASELRAEVAADVRRVTVASLVPAGLLLLLYVWARRYPLPALICALCLWLVLETLEFLLAPAEVSQWAGGGFVMFLIIVGGIKAALEERRYRATLSGGPAAADDA